MTYTISVELYELYDLTLHWTCIAEEMTLLQVKLIMITFSTTQLIRIYLH